MKKIDVYDIDAERIDELCEEHNIQVAELIQMLIEAVDNEDIEIGYY